MVGIAEVSAALGSLKAAKDIIQGLNAAASEATVNDVKIQLQGLILDAQQGLFVAQQQEAALADRISQLEQEVVKLKDWSAEKEKYHLCKIDRDCFAFMPKPGLEESQPPHWLCANCFTDGQKSFMQRISEANGKAIHRCGRCSSDLQVSARTHPAYPDD